MKNVLVTGANGQLGHSIRQLASAYPQYTFLFTDVDTLDICDATAVNTFVKEQSIHYILNCAAYTAVQGEDSELQKLPDDFHHCGSTGYYGYR